MYRSNYCQSGSQKNTLISYCYSTIHYHYYQLTQRADLGYNFRGAQNVTRGLGGILSPQGGLGHSPRSQHIQSYLQPKSSLKWQCQRQLAGARFA